jgi:hypothetical protein
VGPVTRQVLCRQLLTLKLWLMLVNQWVLASQGLCFVCSVSLDRAGVIRQL